MIHFFSFKTGLDNRDVISVGDIKWKTSKYTLIKNLCKVPIDAREVQYKNHFLEKKTWSVLSNSGYKEYVATSLMDALKFMFMNKKHKINKKTVNNIFKRNDCKTI